MNKVGNELKSENTDYQQQVLDYFNNRTKEIELFFELIDKFKSTNPAELIFVDDNIEKIEERDFILQESENIEIVVNKLLKKLNRESIGVELINIFLSNTILLLYNLVESTMSNAITFINKQINESAVEYQEAIIPIQVLWINQKVEIKEGSNNKRSLSLKEKMHPNQVIEMYVKKEEEGTIIVKENNLGISGNLDSKEVDNILKIYGVKTTKEQGIEINDGNRIVPSEKGFKHYGKRQALLHIKSWRNKLAHGEVSFAEFGQSELQYSKETNRQSAENNILFVKKSCLEFFEVVLSNIEAYIISEDYKKS